MECLVQADVIIYDRLANPQLLEHARPEAVKIYAARDPDSQERINRMMVDFAQQGRTVCRLKSGDPFVFGRGGEEAQALRAQGVPFEVVPGVTSAIAAPAYAGIPITHRRYSSSVAFVTGHESRHKEASALRWEHLATGVDTLVILMGMGNLLAIVQELCQHGRPPDTPVALVQWGTYPFQQTVTGTLADIVERVREAGLGPPAVIVVGEVVRLQEELQWFLPGAAGPA
jgi:uroporphyrinogen III methyltransferase/synthase